MCSATSVPVSATMTCQPDRRSETRCCRSRASRSARPGSSAKLEADAARQRPEQPPGRGQRRWAASCASLSGSEGDPGADVQLTLEPRDCRISAMARLQWAKARPRWSWTAAQRRSSWRMASAPAFRPEQVRPRHFQAPIIARPDRRHPYRPLARQVGAGTSTRPARRS